MEYPEYQRSYKSLKPLSNNEGIQLVRFVTPLCKLCLMSRRLLYNSAIGRHLQKMCAGSIRFNQHFVALSQVPRAKAAMATCQKFRTPSSVHWFFAKVLWPGPCQVAIAIATDPKQGIENQAEDPASHCH